MSAYHSRLTPPISATQRSRSSSSCSTCCTPPMNRGNSSNCVHWLYAVLTGTSTEMLFSTLVAIRAPSGVSGLWAWSRCAPVEARHATGLDRLRGSGSGALQKSRFHRSADVGRARDLPLASAAMVSALDDGRRDPHGGAGRLRGGAARRGGRAQPLGGPRLGRDLGTRLRAGAVRTRPGDQGAL